MATFASFNAKFIASSSVRSCRVYHQGQDLFFIQVGSGLSANPEMLTMHFGLVGALIGAALKKKAKKKNDETIQRFDQQNPEQLLAGHKNNFKLYAPEIQEAEINPPAFLAMHGRQAGRMKFVLRDGRKLNFEFETADDLKAALDLLPRLMNFTLKVNVEWDESRKRFQKKKSVP